MGQIELFNLSFKISIISYLKPYSCVQIICIRWEYLINKNTNVKYQYLKPFKWVQTNDQYWIELLVLDRNSWNHLTVCKKNEF